MFYFLVSVNQKERALWFAAFTFHYAFMPLHVCPVRSLMRLLAFCVQGGDACPPSIKAWEKPKEGWSCVCPGIVLNNIRTVFLSCKRVFQSCQVRTLHINLSQLCVPWIVKTQEREEAWTELTPTVQGISLSLCVFVCVKLNRRANTVNLSHHREGGREWPCCCVLLISHKPQLNGAAQKELHAFRDVFGLKTFSRHVAIRMPSKMCVLCQTDFPLSVKTDT